MTQWPKDDQDHRNAFYGDPGKGEIAAQMVPVVPPFAMYYEGKKIKSIMFHRKAAPALLAAFNEIWDYCQHDQAKIDAAGVSNYNGAYNPRMVRGSTTKWSNHAYATAIDLNAGQNALGVKKGTMPQFVVDAFCRQGAMWGGWYHDRPDWMHFEFVDNGGRKPKGPAPVFAAVAHMFDPAVNAPPAEEFEDETSQHDGEGEPPAPPTPPPPQPAPVVKPDVGPAAPVARESFGDWIKRRAKMVTGWVSGGGIGIGGLSYFSDWKIAAVIVAGLAIALMIAAAVYLLTRPKT